MEREAWCEGCGVPLQTEHPDKPGYVPPAALDREHAICKRCFRIRHYNEVAKVEHDPEEYLAMLREVGDRQALVVQVVDLFDFSGSWIPGIQRHIGGNPILILGNKLDLFPKSAKVQRLREWVYYVAGEQGIKPVDVVLTSAVKGYRFDEVARAIEKHREGRDVFVTGTANVGKSTLINRLLKEYGGGEEVITTSSYPGTTLDTIHIPLDDGREIVDMPGIVRQDRMSEWVEPGELDAMTPKSEIRPKVYQLNEGQTLFFGGLARMDYREGPRQSFVLHLANSLYIHRTKGEKADEVWEKHRGGLLSPPKDPSSLPPMRRHTYHLDGKEKLDLVLSGLGWIATGKERARVDLWAPEGVRVEVRRAIL